jgi:hypothetical protein
VASARPSRRPGSPARTVAVAGVAVLSLAGCSATNPITTAEAYNVVDGVQALLDENVAAQNLLILTSGEGEVGALVGALANQSREDVEVTIEIEGADPITVDVPSRGTVLLGPAGEEIEIDSVAAAPGANLATTVSTPQAGSVTLGVPVFDGTLPEYAELVPEADGEA